MSRHHKHFWVFALIYNCLLHQLSLGSPVFVRHFLSEGTGRNIRHLPCVSRRTGETGVCMFAFTCAKANGTHLGTCIDRFYFGSCCKLEEEPDHVFPQDNTIDVDNPPLASKPFLTSSTVAESNDVPGNVDRLKTTTPSTTRLTEAPKTTPTTPTRTTRPTTPTRTTRPTAQPTQPTQPTQTSTQTTRRPPTSSQPTTESIRLSTFQSVQNASEQRPQSLPSLTTVAISRPTTNAPSSTPAFGQRITSKKPPFSSTYNGTKIPVTTSTSTLKPQSVGITRPRPSSSSTAAFTSPTTSTRRNVTSSPTGSSTLNAAKGNLTTILTTIPITVPTTIPTTILATRFPPRNATTPAPSKVAQTTTQPSSTVAESKPSSTRKPTTTKKPIKLTTKRPNSPTKRPSSTPTTKRSPTAGPTSGASPTKSSTAANTTAPTTRRPVASSSKKPIAPLTKKPTSVTSSTTVKPTSQTTSASTTSSAPKRPTGTTLRRPVTTTPAPPRRVATSTTTSPTTSPATSATTSSMTTATKVSATSARPTTTSSTKPVSTRPVSSSAAPVTSKPIKVSAPNSTLSGTSLANITEATRRPSTQPVSSTEPSRKPSTQPASTQTSVQASVQASSTAASTVGQKNTTSHTTVSNELDAEFASEAEHATTVATTATHGIVTWTSFSDDAEPSTKPPESSTVATEATETLDWTPITTPDGWIIIQSPTSSEKPEVEAPAQQKPDTTSSSQAVTTSSPPLVTAKPPTESTTRQTTTTSTTTTTTQRPTTQPSTYVDALSTLATVSLSPDFSPTESPSLPLNMTNFQEVCGRRLFPESRIVGGDGSTFGKWPWQISLRQWRTSTYLHKCGAALLNENWAITAAHCVQNVLPSDLLLRIGEHDLGNEEEPYGFQERRVQIVASHPNFDPRTFEFDLALMRFYEPVLPFQPNVLPICIPDNDEDYVGQTAFVTGWGRLYEDGPLPSVLQEVAVPVINNSVCEGMYRNAGYVEHIPHIFICAGWRKGGFDSCEGDSGGPLVIQRKRDKRWVLAGVISWGIGCAEPNQPGVYTRISEFREWINQILQF